MAFSEFYQSIKLVTCPLFTFFLLLKRAELNLMYFILAFKMEMLCQAEVD